MSFDSFFRDLNDSKNNQREEEILCSCDEIKSKGKASFDGKEIKFEGDCSKEKACFKINYDCSQYLTQKPEIISRKERKEKGIRQPTLDQFLGLSHSNSRRIDIPKPPPPHNDASPNDF